MLQMVSNQQRQEENWITFDTLWSLYPKRVARKDAERAWAKLSEADKMQAITALVDWARVWRARGEMQYVPHCSTWLNGERFHDELPQDCSPRHASHVPAKPQDQTPRGEMPQSVRDAIARLKR